MECLNKPLYNDDNSNNDSCKVMMIKIIIIMIILIIMVMILENNKKDNIKERIPEIKQHKSNNRQYLPELLLAPEPLRKFEKALL